MIVGDKKDIIFAHSINNKPPGARGVHSFYSTEAPIQPCHLRAVPLLNMYSNVYQKFFSSFSGHQPISRKVSDWQRLKVLQRRRPQTSLIPHRFYTLHTTNTMSKGTVLITGITGYVPDKIPP